MTAAAAAVYHRRILRLGDGAGAALVLAWDALGGYDPADSLRWHSTAAPMLTGAAEASLALTSTYSTHSFGTAAAPSPLIAADASARAFDPFDRLASQLAQGATLDLAIRSARAVVAAIGQDSVIRTARQSIGEIIPQTRTTWTRRLNPGACDWCKSLAGVIFDSAHAASFGHDNCGCVPMPTAEVGDANRTLLTAEGWSDDSERRFRRRSEEAQLRRSERTARKRQAQARAGQLTETDPARRERLSIREQEWETRAERAAERLRLLTTGSHRLAA